MLYMRSRTSQLVFVFTNDKMIIFCRNNAKVVIFIYKIIQITTERRPLIKFLRAYQKMFVSNFKLQFSHS